MSEPDILYCPARTVRLLQPAAAPLLSLSLSALPANQPSVCLQKNGFGGLSVAGPQWEREMVVRPS